MNKATKIIVGIVIIVIIVVLIIVFGGEKREKELIRIGFIAPLSGDASIVGQGELNAINLALEKFGGKIAGRNVQIIPEDGKCNGKDAATAVQKLINVDKVKIILGGCCSAETLGVAPITEANKVILFSAFSSSPDISDAGEYIFRITVSDIECGRPLLPYFAKYKRLAMISENSDYSMGIRKGFIPELQKLGVEVVADEVYSPEVRDFKTHLTKIKKSNPEVLFINPSTSPAATEIMVKQIKELGLLETTQLAGNFILASGDILKSIPELLEGAVIYDAPVLDPANKKAQDFLSEYKNRYGEPYSEWDVAARYDSVFIVKNAIEYCKKVDTNCIKDYLYSMPLYEGTVGTYNFDEKGDNEGVKCQLFEVKEGKKTPIL